jgi:hypothetical protein
MAEMTRKPKKAEVPDDCMPKCENCNAGVFQKGEDIGECHLLPMDWIPIGDGDALAKYKPAMRGGWCRHFDRKVN